MISRPVKPKILYVSGAFRGAEFENVGAAIRATDRLRCLLEHLNVLIFTPHFFGFWNMVCPHGDRFWMGMDLAWLDVADAVYVLNPDPASDSSGVKEEIGHANMLGIPVMRNEDYVYAWARQWTHVRPKCDGCGRPTDKPADPASGVILCGACP